MPTKAVYLPHVGQSSHGKTAPVVFARPLQNRSTPWCAITKVDSLVVSMKLLIFGYNFKKSEIHPKFWSLVVKTDPRFLKYFEELELVLPRVLNNEFPEKNENR